MAAFEFVVPVYRKAPHLSETLESLLGQRGLTGDVDVTVRLVEVDRASETEALGLDLTKFPQVRVLRTDKGRGIGGDWEAALAAARAPFATLAHADDTYEDTYAASMLDAFRRFPEAGVVFTDARYMDPSPRRHALRAIRRVLNPARFANQPTLITPDAMHRALRFGNLVACPSVAYHLPLLRRQLGSEPWFDRTFKNATDWKAWLTMSERRVSFVYVPRPLMRLRVHAGSTTQATIATGDRSREERAILEAAWGPQIGRLLFRAIEVGQRLQRVANAGEDGRR